MTAPARPPEPSWTILDAAEAKFALDPIFHAKVDTLAHTILQVVSKADRDYALDAQECEMRGLSPRRSQHEVRVDQLRQAIALWAIENP